MKKFFFTLLFTGLALLPLSAEKIECQVSLKQGTVNGLPPTASITQIKKRMPFFTGTSKEKDWPNSGGGVFFKNTGVYFYTYIDVINVRDDFSGQMDIPVFGKTLEQIAADFEMDCKFIQTQEFGDLYECKQNYGYLYFCFEDGLCAELYITTKPIEICEARYKQMIQKQKKEK